jgi:hypothetical protein
MPILGTIASQVPANLPTNSYESIAAYTVGEGGTSSFTFSSIPSTYKHLQVRGIALNTGQDTLFMAFNSDTTGSNYRDHQLGGNVSSIFAYSSAGVNGGGAGIGLTSQTTGAGNIIDILDYASTNKYKTSRCLWGVDRNSAGSVGIFSSLWTSKSAVNSITFTTFTYPFTQYASFALYGIKG